MRDFASPPKSLRECEFCDYYRWDLPHSWVMDLIPWAPELVFGPPPPHHVGKSFWLEDGKWCNTVMVDGDLFRQVFGPPRSHLPNPENHATVAHQ